MSGTAGHIYPPLAHGFAVQAGTLDMLAPPANTWVDCPVEVDLPSAGVYQLDGNVHANLTGGSEINVSLVARLFDVTAGVEVPDSESVIEQAAARIEPVTSTVYVGGNQNAPILTQYTATGPATIRLQALRTPAVGTADAAQIFSAPSGRTTLRFLKVR